MEYDQKFIAAWEDYTGLTWAEDYHGGFRLSFRDFKAGWDASSGVYDPACSKCGDPLTSDELICDACHLTSTIHADGESEPIKENVAFSCCGGIDAHRSNCRRR